MKKINKKGFTLIELLVVVAIIAVLAGIVLVSLGSARERSRKASLQSTVASVIPVASMCVNDGYYVGIPTSSTAGGGYICTPNSDGTQPAVGSETDILEEWPALTHITGASYAYGTTDTTSIIATDGAATPSAVVTCTVATGSCVRN